MKVLTLNCHAWQEEEQEYKIRYLAKTIVEQDYDVVALQEVSQHEESNSLQNGFREDNYMLLLLKEIEKLGTMHYKGEWTYVHKSFEVYEEGVCIITKHPIISTQSFYVTQSHDPFVWKSRKIIKVTIDYKGQEIDCYSCHLGWWKDDEEPYSYQIDQLNAKIIHNRLSIMMGDFNNNANIREEGYDYICLKNWYDTYRLAARKDSGVTVKGKIAGWEKNKLDLRIDLVWMNKDIPVISSNVIFNGENGEIISDHYGVSVELEV